MTQVDFVAHSPSSLRPADTAGALSGVTVAAMVKRLALGLVIDRLDPVIGERGELCQRTIALGLMLAIPRPAAFYAGCVRFGLSVGNVITLLALIIQRELAARTFGLGSGL